ncbi:MAG: type II secretion system F family protein [Candidatus Margulisiibacteriota bacterium]
MPIFNYKAKSRYGVDISGKVEAENISAVANRLKEMGYLPLEINPQEQTLSAQLAGVSEYFSKVKAEELIIFTRQLATILDAGVPLLEALDALFEQVVNPKFKKIILKMKGDIEGGASFSEALRKEPKVFSPVYIAMVRAGESGGILGEVLARLGDLLEKDFETVRAIKSATRYPIMVISALVIAFVVVINFVVPRFAELYKAYKTDLPLPTKMLIGINGFMQRFGIFIVIFILIAAFLFKKALEVKSVRMRWDKMVISIPVFGNLLLKLSLARFCHLLGAMLKSGIPIVEAFTITQASIQNMLINKVIDDIKEDVISGKSISEPMKGSRVFPPLVVQMVAIGEKSGSLEQMLEKIGDYYDRDTDYMIKNLTPLIEPILILFLAIMVAFLAMGIFLPMWDMVKFVKT